MTAGLGASLAAITTAIATLQRLFMALYATPNSTVIYT